ncbi:hypothetical protein M422DRAFT_31054 [Sphaerobolus stellatus SS14]|uniref:Uncharacterized protein n=1 Tax=Sphaerobolus stellatus (strain SS14) TaxID=990650 RepID=A0A0C9UJB3_SPHS4|nr:hypothetical protein M422DRAFT_31054 [Sphaerobolus stellatus SS14]
MRASLFFLFPLLGIGYVNPEAEVEAEDSGAQAPVTQPLSIDGACAARHAHSRRALGHGHEFEARSPTCEYAPHKSLTRRDTPLDGTDVGVGVGLPSVGLSLGNITTKLGNINLTVTNITISVGNIDVENIEIGNITVIVSVPLPGASPIQAFSAFTSATSISSSTATATSTVSPATSVTQAARFFRRQDDSLTTVTPTPTPTETSGGSGPVATATVTGGPVSLDTGSIDTEIGNITIFVGNVNVSLGDVKIRNVTIGNVFVFVQVGQPDLTGAIGNLTNTLGGVPL